MSPRLRSALRAAVIASGMAIVVLAATELRAADWPVYAVFTLVATLLYLFYVEVLPNMPLPIPGLAATIGFLYIGGLPIVLFQIVASVLSHLLYGVLPDRWRRWAHPGSTEWTVTGYRAFTFFGPDWGAFFVGLATRWWIAAALAPDARPTAHPGVMAIAEAGSYVVWTLVSALPIYAFRSPIWSLAERGFQPLMQDMRMIFLLGLTPFVFLIAYGYEAHGLAGAAGWSLSTIGLHAMLKSLHERRIALEEQNRRLEALNREFEHRERLSAIGKMSSVVSHQMLQQLGIIRLHADLVRNAEVGADPVGTLAQAKANAGRIDDALDDLNRVLTDLLVFSRDLRLNLYEHPLDRVLVECVDECLPLATERDVTLRLACPGELHLILDKLKVKQAVVNVIRNALEASPKGGEVTVEGRLRDGTGEIVVSDQGPGVAPDRRGAVFTPFFTTKEHGSGLGLAIAREFVVAHGGQVEFGNGAGGGARVVIRLPRRPAEE